MEDLPDVGVLLAHSDHDTLVTRATNNGARGRGDQPEIALHRVGNSREDSARGIVT